MNNDCEKIQEQLSEYMSGDMPAEGAKKIELHIETCPVCREYLSALRSDEELLEGFVEALQPTVSRLEENVIDALNKISPEKTGASRVFRLQWLQFAAAAMLVLAVGLVIGRATAPRGPSMEQLCSELEPSIKESMLAELDERWQGQFTTSCTRLKDELRQQVQSDLAEFAAQTLTASKTLTDKRIVELVQLIEAARLRDRQRVATALEQIEINRMRDKAEFASNLQTLSVTPDETSIRQAN